MAGKQTFGVVAVSLCRRKHTMSTVYRPVKTIAPTAKGGAGSTQSVNLSKSQRLMADNGLIRQSSCPGSFHLLPVALRSLEKLVRLVDKFMEKAGCQKIQMPILTSETLWSATGRLDECAPELMTVADRHNKRFLLSPTHEEAVCDLINGCQTSYRQLPLRLYQITDKFRDEKRPRFGLLRARQFLMKDLYTFDTTEENAIKTYDEIVTIYGQLFDSLGLKWTKASGTTGTIGGKQSDEFHLISEVGEDNVIHCHSCNVAFNEELITNTESRTVAVGATSQSTGASPNPTCIKCGSSDLSSSKSIEIGHAFLLGTKYTQPLKTTYITADNESVLMEMGCYGIGVSRLLAAALEVSSTDKELRWPVSIAPYLLSILPPKGGSKEAKVGASLFQNFYKVTHELLGNDVIIDDRLDQTVGKRLLDAKKLGIPYVAVFGKSLITDSGTPLIELQDTNNGTVQTLSYREAVNFMYDAKVKSEV